MGAAPGSKTLQRLWLGGIASVALLQITLGLAGLVASAAGFERPRLASTEIPDLYRWVAVLSLGCLAAYLLLGGKRDPRVSRLGVLFLVLAVFYASPAIESLALAVPDGATLLRFVAAVRVDAFTPALVWWFFRDFPRALEWPRTARLVSWILTTCTVAAVGLIAVNLAIALGAEAPFLSRFDRANPASHYWTVVFGLMLPAPPFVAWRLRHAPEDERRRVRLFTMGLVVGGIPQILFAVLPPLSSDVEAWARQEQNGVRIAQALMLLSTLWIAGSTAYAVAVQRVLQVGTILRKAAQYAVVRLATAAATVVPFLTLILMLYRSRGEPISVLFEGPRSLLSLGLVTAGVVLLQVRRGMMSGLDRLLFRERYDARRILVNVAERSRTMPSIGALATSLSAEIDRALHVESIALLVQDANRETFVPVAGAARALPRSWPLVGRLVEAHSPLVVELDRDSSPLRNLPEADRQWLADGAVELLVPLIGSDGEPIGILALGAKRSELPYSKEDLLLLSGIGNAAGIGLENRLLHASAGRRLPSVGRESGAAECSGCGWLGEPGGSKCPTCGSALAVAHLPHSLFGKFRLEGRIGEGAMGVVYRATDIALGRQVALKTLPYTSPEDSVRLRREARAMASITHPNLALIFGAETWQGTPVLVIEYLAGGTLTDRLARGRLAPAEALRLARTLADVLERTHGSGILHRDIKPSNIGFTEQQVPKLLDFGLVRIAGESALMGAMRTALPSLSDLSDTGLAGTPLYMSPEALAGAPPDPTFDLWSLGVVAFESLAGVHPFERDTPSATIAAIREGRRSALDHLGSEAASLFDDLFDDVLAPDRGRRPPTARKLCQALEEAESRLPAVGDATRLMGPAHGGTTAQLP